MADSARAGHAVAGAVSDTAIVINAFSIGSAACYAAAPTSTAAAPTSTAAASSVSGDPVARERTRPGGARGSGGRCG